MSVLPFKEDEDFTKHNSKAMEAAAKDLKLIVDDIESLSAQITDLNRDKSDCFTVAKAKGFNVKALRKLIAERKRDKQDLDDEMEALEHYRSLLL